MRLTYFIFILKEHNLGKMKYIIVGLHGSGKQEIMNELEEAGLPVGRLFTNGDLNDDRYTFFSDQEVRTIFENNAYIFIKELGEMNNVYEGLSFREFDDRSIFALTPDQFLAIPHKAINEEICIIWLDGTTAARRNRYISEKRNYAWNEEEDRERRNISEFINMIYNFPKSHLLYFHNEVPSRVAAIVEALIRHEDLIPLFTNKFE